MIEMQKDVILNYYNKVDSCILDKLDVWGQFLKDCKNRFKRERDFQFRDKIIDEKVGSNCP